MSKFYWGAQNVGLKSAVVCSLDSFVELMSNKKSRFVEYINDKLCFVQIYLWSINGQRRFSFKVLT